MYTVHLPPLSTWQYHYDIDTGKPTRECRWVEQVNGKQLVVMVRATGRGKRRTIVVEEARITGEQASGSGWGTLDTLDPTTIGVEVAEETKR